MCIRDRSFHGTVAEIATKGTEQNGVASFDVTVSIDQPTGLKENMTANVEILVAAKEGVLLLPIEAVQERQGRKFVIMATDGNDGGSAGNAGSSNAGESAGTGKGTGAGAGMNSGGDGAEGRAAGGNQQGSMRPVETGLYNETMIEITSGLQEGDIVTIPNVARSTEAGARSMFGGGAMGGGGGRPGQMIIR
jgi:HlyD family secretion protein